MSESSIDFGKHSLNDGCSIASEPKQNLFSFDSLLIRMMTRGLSLRLRDAILGEKDKNRRVIFGVPGFTIRPNDFPQNAVIFLKAEDYFVDRRLPEEITGDQRVFSYQKLKLNEVVVVRESPHSGRLKFISCGKPYDILAGSNRYKFIEDALTSTDCVHTTEIVRNQSEQKYLRDNFRIYKRAELLV